MGSSSKDLGDRIAAGVALLRKGGVVAFPTDTLYGLGADIASPSAVQRILDVKGRPEEMGLPLLLADTEDLEVDSARRPKRLLVILTRARHVLPVGAGWQKRLLPIYVDAREQVLVHIVGVRLAVVRWEPYVLVQIERGHRRERYRLLLNTRCEFIVKPKRRPSGSQAKNTVSLLMNLLLYAVGGDRCNVFFSFNDDHFHTRPSSFA